MADCHECGDTESEQAVIEALHRLPHGVQVAMGVDLHSDIYVRMPGDGLNQVRRHAQLQEQGHHRVPEIMKPDVRHPGPLREPLVHVADLVAVVQSRTTGSALLRDLGAKAAARLCVAGIPRC